MPQRAIEQLHRWQEKRLALMQRRQRILLSTCKLLREWMVEPAFAAPPAPPAMPACPARPKLLPGPAGPADSDRRHRTTRFRTILTAMSACKRLAGSRGSTRGKSPAAPAEEPVLLSPRRPGKLSVTNLVVSCGGGLPRTGSDLLGARRTPQAGRSRSPAAGSPGLGASWGGTPGPDPSPDPGLPPKVRRCVLRSALCFCWLSVPARRSQWGAVRNRQLYVLQKRHCSEEKKRFDN